MKNNFSRLLNFKISLAIIAIISLSLVLIPAYADVISPLKQIGFGVSINDVVCRENLVKVIRASDGSPACVKSTTVTNLVNIGWAKPLESISNNRSNGTIGYVNKIALNKELIQGDLTKLNQVRYNFVFEVCANQQEIRAPEVSISSDSQVKSVKLAVDKISQNTCTSSAVKIQALDPNTIKAQLLNMGTISSTIIDLENKINDTQNKIKIQKDSLLNLEKQNSTSGFGSSVSAINDNITKLRSDLNDYRHQLYKYQFLLYSYDTSKLSDLISPKSLTGEPIVGLTIKTLSITEQITNMQNQIGVRGYNVVYSVCAGNTPEQLPKILVSSDSEQKSVILSDKIPKNDCQLGTAKINAVDSKSIIVQMDKNALLSSKIITLQSNLDSLQLNLQDKKNTLKILVTKSPKPDNYDQTLNSLTSDIIDLRNQIDLAKAQSILFALSIILV